MIEAELVRGKKGARSLLSTVLEKYSDAERRRDSGLTEKRDRSSCSGGGGYGEFFPVSGEKTTGKKERTCSKINTLSACCQEGEERNRTFTAEGGEGDVK